MEAWDVLVDTLALGVGGGNARCSVCLGGGVVQERRSPPRTSGLRVCVGRRNTPLYVECGPSCATLRGAGGIPSRAPAGSWTRSASCLVRGREGCVGACVSYLVRWKPILSESGISTVV